MIVSGAIGEDLAVAAVRLGAVDYILKDRLARLGTAVQNALEQTRSRRRQREAQRALEHQALHDNLTNLPNRLMLQQRVKQALTERPTVALLQLAVLLLPDPVSATALHPASGALPSAAKLTLPVGFAPLTVAVKVTLLPSVVGLPEVASVVLVGSPFDATK